MATNLGIFMPEVVLYKMINSFINLAKVDFEEYPEEETLLYNLFKNDECGDLIRIESFKYYEQAKDLFLQSEIQTNIGYNTEVSDIACIHIMLPSESGKPFGIGADENYIDPIVKDGELQSVFTKRFDCTYNIMITSNNAMEVLLIYNFLKGCMISANYHLELSGLRDPKISGQDINVTNSMVPTNIYHRSLSVNFFYEASVPDMIRHKIAKRLNAEQVLDNKQ